MKTNRTLRRDFSLSVSFAALLIATMPSLAKAQDVQDPNSAETLPADGSEAEGEAIVVTGSRIARPELQTANPVTTFDRESIVLSGRTNLTDFLQQSPALIGSSDSGDNSGSNAGIGATGLNLLDLRNLGTNRTLVLIDGRRHVAAVPGSASIDVNSIPTDLVQRVDIVTGGASAVYGADGVSGVVNFITRRDFEGISARGQVGVSSRGDAGNQFISVTAGTNFADDRGNVAFNYEYNNEGRLEAYDRKRNLSVNRTSLVRNPDDTADDPNVPDRIPLADIRFYDSSRAGAIDIDFDGIPDFLPDGSVFNPGRFVPDFFQQGGSGTPQSDFIGDLLPQNSRHSFNGLFSYKLTDDINFFAQGKFVRTNSFSISQPTFDFYLFVPESNPYLSQAVRNQIIPGIGEAVFGPGAEDGVLVNRDNFDLGVRGEDIRRETIRTVVGFDGNLTDNARFELSYVYGQSKARNQRQGNRYNDRFLAAIDAVVDPATGNVVCRSTLNPAAAPDQPFASTSFPGFISFTPGANSGCVPLNIFGEGAPSQQAINFVTTTSVDTSKITQHVVSGSVSGDFGAMFELPGGPIGFAFGAEYRKETSRSTPAPEDTAGSTFGNIIFPSRGSYSVKEAFAELNVPVLKGVPFAEELSFGAAIRYSDYSTVGSTVTWKVDAVYSPIRDIKFRGTIAEAVRAPNIGELFDPASQTFEFITDPCDQDELENGTGNRVANCTALLSGLGVANPAAYNDTASASISGFSQGNANLREETAKTKTLGVVFQPSFLRGFTFAVDGYDIKLENAINQVSAQEIADLCVDQPNLDNVFCDAITRQSGGATPGRITNFLVQPENVASFRTRGVDFTANYSFEPGDLGRFNARVVGGYLDRLEFTGTPGGDITDSRNLPGAPKWVVTGDLTYKKGPWTLNYGVNYFSKTQRYSRNLREAQPDIAAPEFKMIKAKWEHDIQASVDVDEKFSFYAGVNNLWDEKPDFASTSFPVNAIGRYMYIGVTTKLDGLFN